MHVTIYEGMFNVILTAHVGLGSAMTVQNILNKVKQEWYDIAQADIQLIIDLHPVCVVNREN